MADDPQAAKYPHDTPDAVRNDPGLSNAEKIRILESWAYDDAEASVALEEGMPGESARVDRVQQVLRVLDELSSGLDLDHSAPSKQHGIPSGSLKSR